MTSTLLARGEDPVKPARLPLTPVRRLVLAIGVPIAIALIGWTGFSFVADVGQGSYTVNYSIPVRAGQLSLNAAGGEVTVRPGGQPGVGHLTGIVHYSLIRPRFTWNPTASGTAASLGCRIPVGDCDLDATLEAPARTALSLRSGGGSLSVSGMTGDVTLSSGGGELTVTGLRGDLRLSTGGGDIHGNALLASDVSVQTGGGDVTLAFTGPPRNLQIRTAGGNITVILPHSSTPYKINATTGGGVITDPVPQDTASPYVISASTGGGNITITEAS